RYTLVARVPDVLVARVLRAGDFVWFAAAAVVVAGDAGVRRRALRPVDPVVLDEDLLGRVVAGGQASYHRSDRSGGEAHLHDARSVVALARGASHTLVGIRGEESSALEVLLEGQSARRTVSLEAVARSGGLA